MVPKSHRRNCLKELVHFQCWCVYSVFFSFLLRLCILFVKIVWSTVYHSFFVSDTVYCIPVQPIIMHTLLMCQPKTWLFMCCYIYNDQNGPCLHNNHCNICLQHWKYKTMWQNRIAIERPVQRALSPQKSKWLDNEAASGIILIRAADLKKNSMTFEIILTF